MTDLNFARYFAQNLTEFYNPVKDYWSYNNIPHEEIPEIFNKYGESILYLAAIGSSVSFEKTLECLSDLPQDITWIRIYERLLKRACLYLEKLWIEQIKLEKLFTTYELTKESPQ